MTPLIELVGLSKRYQLGESVVRALDDVTLQIHRGEFVAIMGPSGSGKTTLLNILGTLDRPSSGEYRFLGKNLVGLPDRDLSEFRNRSLGFVFQSFHLIAQQTAAENVALPVRYSGLPLCQARVHEVLAQVGLTDRMSHRPSQLSGGQQQRVAIARALVNDPEMILADEPTGNLDSASAGEILELLTDLNRDGKSIVIVTHDPAVAARCQRVVRFADGKVVSSDGENVSLITNC